MLHTHHSYFRHWVLCFISLKVFRVQNVGMKIMCGPQVCTGFEVDLMPMVTRREAANMQVGLDVQTLWAGSPNLPQDYSQDNDLMKSIALFKKKTDVTERRTVKEGWECEGAEGEKKYCNS